MAAQMTNLDMSNFLRGKLTWPILLILDSKYSILDESKAPGFFSDIANQTTKLVGEWLENIRDCDKFARIVAVMAMLSHMKQNKQLTGVALGAVGYVSDGQGPHCINFIVTKNTKGTMLLTFYEPQTGFKIDLSDKEKKSILWAII